MNGAKRVILDAGHGGVEPGAVFEGRQEKNDNLRLALAVGQILSRNGVEVGYTRVSDVYHTPMEKARMSNRAGADYFVSLHRNAMPIPGSASGSMTLVYDDSGVAGLMAGNINEALKDVGFQDLGTIERPDIIVLRRTQAPAVLVEAGFIDNAKDNQFFDQNFQRIAAAIADGILTTIQEEEEEGPEYYQVQVGAYTSEAYAKQVLNQLLEQDFPAFLVHADDLYKVRVGAFLNLDNAARMEQMLRNMGYNTVMVREPAVK